MSFRKDFLLTLLIFLCFGQVLFPFIVYTLAFTQLFQIKKKEETYPNLLASVYTLITGLSLVILLLLGPWIGQTSSLPNHKVTFRFPHKHGEFELGMKKRTALRCVASYLKCNNFVNSFTKILR